MDTHFTGVFQQVDRGWIGYVEELPGANTQGSTLEFGTRSEDLGMLRPGRPH